MSESTLAPIRQNYQIEYPETQEKIEALRREVKEAIPDPETAVQTASGYENVKTMLQLCTNRRTAIERRRVDLKADALKFGREVDSLAKSLREGFESIEAPLRAAKQKIDDARKKAEEDRLRAEKEKAEAEAKEKAEREKREKEDAERRTAEEKAEADRIAAARPDVQKIHDFSESLSAWIDDNRPDLKNPHASSFLSDSLNEIHGVVTNMSAYTTPRKGKNAAK